MKSLDDIEIIINRVGAPIVNYAYVFKASDDIVCIEVDMKSKYCEVIAIGSNSIWIGATANSLHLNEEISRNEATEIIFPTFEDWEIFTAVGERYTIRICFYKWEKNHATSQENF